MNLYNEIFDLLDSALDHPSSSSAFSPIVSSSALSSSACFPSTPSPSRNVQFVQQLFTHTPVQFRILHFSGQNFQTQVLFDARPCLHDKLVSAAAKLHTKYGLTHLDKTRPRSRGIARESCYALNNNHPANFYGPFMPDRSGRINWAYLEALSVVVGFNLLYARQAHLTSDLNNPPPQPTQPPGVLTTPIVLHPPESNIVAAQPTDGEQATTNVQIGPTWADIDWPILTGLTASRPNTQIMNPAYIHPAPPWPPSSGHDQHTLDLNRYDWAGVEGKWLRVVCFLDYRDLHAYNCKCRVIYESSEVILTPVLPSIFLVSGANPRPQLDDHNEAIRLMTLDLKVVSIGEAPSQDPSHPVPPGLCTSGRPPIYFRGTSA